MIQSGHSVEIPLEGETEDPGWMEASPRRELMTGMTIRFRRSSGKPADVSHSLAVGDRTPLQRSLLDILGRHPRVLHLQGTRFYCIGVPFLTSLLLLCCSSHTCLNPLHVLFLPPGTFLPRFLFSSLLPPSSLCSNVISSL